MWSRRASTWGRREGATRRDHKVMSSVAWRRTSEENDGLALKTQLFRDFQSCQRIAATPISQPPPCIRVGGEGGTTSQIERQHRMLHPSHCQVSVAVAHLKRRWRVSSGSPQETQGGRSTPFKVEVAEGTKAIGVSEQAENFDFTRQPGTQQRVADLSRVPTGAVSKQPRRRTGSGRPKQGNGGPCRRRESWQQQ